jgi:hypothetical protein
MEFKDVELNGIKYLTDEKSYVDEYFNEQHHYDHFYEICDYEEFERILYEAYVTPELKWIDSFVEDLQDYSKTVSNASTLSNLSSIEKISAKYGLDIAFDDSNFGIGPMSISGGYFSRKAKRYFLRIGHSFLTTFKRTSGSGLLVVKNMLRQVFTHEDTHEQQTKDIDDFTYDVIVNRRKDKIEKSKNKDVTYHTDYFEIDAFARGLAETILNLIPDKYDDLLDALRNDKLEELVSRFSGRNKFLFDRVRIYFKLKKSHPKVWKKFVKEMYDYVQNKE